MSKPMTPDQIREEARAFQGGKVKLIKGILQGVHPNGLPWARPASNLEKALWRDATTLRLIVKHRMFIDPRGCWSACAEGRWSQGPTLYAAVRKAAKGGA